MMPLLSIKQFLNDMRRQKLRTALTMFGIFWGTCSIILLFAFGQGLKEQQLKSQKGLGENIAIFWPGITSKDYKGMPRGRRIQPTEDDIKLIKAKAVTLSRISPEFSRWNVMMKYGKNETLRNVVGIWPEFGEMRNLIPEVGSRFINDRDIAEQRRVVFIGDLLARDLLGGASSSESGGSSFSDDPSDYTSIVGETILLNGMPFTVVGVMKEKKQDSSYNGRDSRKAFIPSSTFNTMYSRRHLNNFVAQNKPELTMRQTKREIYEILASKYQFDPSDTEALSVWDTTRGFAFLKNFFNAFQWFLVGIGIATLITGAIGVSNIMNVVLEERTKEIGIKMALGARKSTILSQFVFETLLITAIGGFLGFLFAMGLVEIVLMLNLQDYIGTPRVNVVGGLVVTTLLGIVGFTAGIFPARRAANLQPVQALKLF